MTPTPFRDPFLDSMSPLAFGCWRFAGASVDEATVRVRAAVDAGLTLIDTADIYGFDGAGGFGAAESLLGEVLSTDRALAGQIVLATKAGIRPPLPYDQSADYLSSACDASLTRLGVERIDLFQIHRPDLLAHPSEVADCLAGLVRAGKVGHVGVSNFTVCQHRALDAHLRAAGVEQGIVTTQPEWNLLHLDPLVDGTLDWCLEVGARPLVWSPLAGGRLVDGSTGPDRPADVSDGIAGPENGRHRLAAVRCAATRLADELGCSTTALYLAWLMAHPSSPIPIVGTQNPDRIRSSAEAVDVTLTRSQWYELLTAARGGTAAVTSTCVGHIDVAWFGALCDDDAEQLGVPAPELVSSWVHCSALASTVDRLGFDSILLPSGYDLGIDTVAFAAAIAPSLEHLAPLVAVRCGEVWLPTMVRQLATLDQILGGRLRVNIISSDLPGQTLDSESRYGRTLETMTGLRALMSGEPVKIDGDWIELSVTPPRILRDAPRCPPLYFGGLSPAARDVAAQQADVYLMWPDTLDGAAEVVADLRRRAESFGRTLRFGYRTHVVVRDTEADARRAAAHLVAQLDEADGAARRSRSLDAGSFGVARQGELRSRADANGYVTRHLWTGIGRGRSGCGAAIVGDPEQVARELAAYVDIGMDTFILSGYPHRSEAERFARDVLPILRAGNGDREPW